MQTPANITPEQMARELRRHCEKHGAGFYTDKHGRCFGARVRAGALQVTPDFESWVPASPACKFWNHAGRSIGNLPSVD